MVRFLIEHGAPVSATTRASYTPLHQAAQQGHNNVVRYLLEHGASPNVHTSVIIKLLDKSDIFLLCRKALE